MGFLEEIIKLKFQILNGRNNKIIKPLNTKFQLIFMLEVYFLNLYIFAR